MRKLILLVVGLISLFDMVAQTTISGIVENEQGQGLASVNIQVKGTSLITTTDEKGHFEMQLPESSAYDITYAKGISNPVLEKPILTIALDGYESTEYELASKRKVKITLQANQMSSVLPERALLTATQRIARHEPSWQWQDYLGNDWGSQIAGWQFGALDGSPTFNVRGLNQLQGNQQLLVVLDGFFLNQFNLQDIQPEDIKHVEFLPNAAQYGSLGGNGVIEIQTHRGNNLKLGTTQVTYHTQFGFSQNVQPYSLNNATNRAILNPDAPQPLLGDLNATQQFNTPLPNLQDYQSDLLFQRGNYSTHHLDIKGRSGATNYYASVNRLRDEGILQSKDGLTRTSLRLNLDHQLHKKWTLQTSAAYSFSNQSVFDGSTQGSFAQTFLLIPMFDLNVRNEEDNSLYDWDIDNTGNGIVNPFYLQENITQTARSNRLMGSVVLTHEVNNWLKLRYLGSADRAMDERSTFVEKGFLSTTYPEYFGRGVTNSFEESNGGGLRKETTEMESLYASASALFDKQWLGLQWKGGLQWNYENTSNAFESIQGEDLTLAAEQSLNNLNRNIQIASIEESAATYSGVAFGHLNYKNKYLFDGSFRQEQSSLFDAPQHFYQYGVAYRLSEDIKIKHLQELKLFVNTGQTGIRPTYQQRFGATLLQNGTATEVVMANPDLLPMLTEALEVGVDITFWRAFDLQFTYFQRNTQQQILLVPLSASTGVEAQWQNAGTVENTGYEANLSIDFSELFRSKASGFIWQANTNFFKSNPLINELAVPAFSIHGGYQIAEGQELGAIAGNVFLRDLNQLMNDANTNDFVVNEIGYVVRESTLGTTEERPIQWSDENGNPQVEAIGNINPDFRVGISNTIGYKQLKLHTLFDWQQGGQIYNHQKQLLYSTQRHQDFEANVAAGFFDALYNEGQINNHFVEDASYFRLREVALLFHLEQAQLGNLQQLFKQVQIGIRGRNLWSSNDLWLFAPSSLAATAPTNRFTYPAQRSFALDLKVVF